MVTGKTHKRKKKSRMHGRKMGTHGGGARKKRKKSGHRGGSGMAGSGKRSDHKKTLVKKKHGHGYFGKKGFTSRGTKKDKRQRINLQDIETHIEKYGKKSGDKWEVNLKGYKILGEGKVKSKLIIKANDSSESARKKVEAAGGEIIFIHSPKRGQMKATEASKSAIEKVGKAGGEIVLPGKGREKKEEVGKEVDKN